MNMQTTDSFSDYEAAAKGEGFDEVLVREWLPDQRVGTHTHPFDVKARVVRGEVWLSCDGRTQHLRAGEGFELARERAHEERYGPVGATFWVARRHPT